MIVGIKSRSVGLWVASVLGVSLPIAMDAMAAPDSLTRWSECHDLTVENREIVQDLLRPWKKYISVAYDCSAGVCRVSFYVAGKREIYMSPPSPKRPAYICASSSETPIDDGFEECRDIIDGGNFFIGIGRRPALYNISIVNPRGQKFNTWKCLGAEVPQYPMTDPNQKTPQFRVFFIDRGKLTIMEEF